MALPELDLSAIKDKSLIRQILQTPRTPKPERNVHQKSESSLSTSLRTGLVSAWGGNPWISQDHPHDTDAAESWVSPHPSQGS